MDWEMQSPADMGSLYEANDLLDRPQALRARLAEDGYLFLRQIIEVDALRDLRDRLTRILADLGWIRGGDDRLDARAISAPCREGEPRYLEALSRIVRLEALHSLAHREELMAVMRAALGDSAFPHPLSITRLIYPATPELSTPPHQDFPNNQGTSNLTAAWIPLGDCSREEGSLAVLEGSHKFGLLPLAFHLGAGNRAAVLDERLADCRWLAADFRTGDIILFPALTVHRALENRSADRMRLSVDFRYQLEGEELTEGCLRPHFDVLSWEEIYRDWNSDRHKYYWQRKQFSVVPWDESLHALPEGHMDEALRQEIRYINATRARFPEGS